MSYYDEYSEDFYCEQGEFDEHIENLKTALKSPIQKEFLDEMEKLRKENGELREFRNLKEKYERELKEKKREYDIKIRNAEIEADRKKLKDLLSLVSAIGYRVKIDYIKDPKCNKCDNNRYISFISPLGREMKEPCLCDTAKKIYNCTEVELISFRVAEKLSDVYYELAEKNRESNRYEMIAELYDENKHSFDELNLYRCVFLRKEDCEQYCNWLYEQDKINQTK